MGQDGWILSALNIDSAHIDVIFLIFLFCVKLKLQFVESRDCDCLITGDCYRAKYIKSKHNQP